MINICFDTLNDYMKLVYDTLNLLKDCEISNKVVKDEIIEAFCHINNGYNELLKDVKSKVELDDE